MILFILEGEKTEKRIVEKLKCHFFNHKESILCAYCNNIYKLYRELAEDQYLDVFLLLKQIDHNRSILQKYLSSDISQIYLFFDYDGHDNYADDSKAQSVLSYFQEETSNGKLYISYPMAESLIHIPIEGEFKNLTASARISGNYKNRVHNESYNEYKQIPNLSRTLWKNIISMHLSKLNYIVNGDYSLPSELVDQLALFDNQLRKYIVPKSEVSIISGFPIFIQDYYGVRHTQSLLS